MALPLLYRLVRIAASNFMLFRRHLWRCLVEGPFTGMMYIYTSTEVFNMWLRAMGSKIGRQCWLSEFFRCRWVAAGHAALPFGQPSQSRSQGRQANSTSPN